MGFQNDAVESVSRSPVLSSAGGRCRLLFQPGNADKGVASIVIPHNIEIGGAFHAGRVIDLTFKGDGKPIGMVRCPDHVEVFQFFGISYLSNKPCHRILRVEPDKFQIPPR